MKRTKLAFIVLALLVGAVIAVSSAAGFTGHKPPPGQHGKAGTNATMRWDIISVNFATDRKSVV